MEKKLTYFGIYKLSYKFNELEDIEQKSILINNNIYIKGKSEIQYDEDLVHPFYDNKSQNINYIGKDFVLDNEHYTLNKDFIEEVYDVITEHFKNSNLKNIVDYLKGLKLYYENLDYENEKFEFLKTTQLKAKEEYLKELNDKIFQDFVQSKNELNFEENVIKKHLIYDKMHLSDYIFGLDNFGSFLSISTYNKFLRLTEILNFCKNNKIEIEKYEIEKIDFKNPSVPKSIAMLKVSGFLEMESLKKLNSSKLHQIIAIIIGQDPNNVDHLRGIRGNMSVFNASSGEDYTKYTSQKRAEEMQELLDKIKKGNF